MLMQTYLSAAVTQRPYWTMRKDAGFTRSNLNPAIKLSRGGTERKDSSHLVPGHVYNHHRQTKCRFKIWGSTSFVGRIHSQRAPPVISKASLTNEMTIRNQREAHLWKPNRSRRGSSALRSHIKESRKWSDRRMSDPNRTTAVQSRLISVYFH